MDLEKIVKELRDRVTKAEQRGQVELHLDLSTVHLLVSVAELVVQARKGK